jgi:hypothetical protein
VPVICELCVWELLCSISIVSFMQFLHFACYV